MESEDDWIDHEKWQHNLVWCCDGFEHPPETFTSRDNFENHMKLLHADTFQVGQLEMLAKISAKPSSIIFEHCPFCDYSNGVGSDASDHNTVGTRARPRQVSMQEHISSHLLNLFLLALPERDDLVDNGSTALTSMTDSRSIRSLKDVELSFWDDDLSYDRDDLYDPILGSPRTAGDEWAFNKPENETSDSDPVLTSMVQYLRTREEIAQSYARENLQAPKTLGDSSDFQTDQLQQISILRYGIMEVYTPTPPSMAQVDLVLVHGLGGHPKHTWTSRNQVFWPKDLLPSYIHKDQVRVLVYGYMVEPGHVMNPDPVTEHAERLLTDLYLNRKNRNTHERPIIFLAHSYGGFIVSSALSSARKKFDNRQSLFVSTYGLLFLGKPNYRPGIELDRWKNCLERLYRGVDIKFGFGDTEQAVQSLLENSRSLQEIDIEFWSWASLIRTYCFHEAPISVNGSPQYIVDEELASPHEPDCERAGIMAGHFQMCIFDNENSTGFLLVVEAIQRYAEEAVETIKDRWAVEHKKEGGIPKVEYPDSVSVISHTPSNAKAADPYFVVPQTFRPNYLFVGRAKELQQLASWISHPSPREFNNGFDCCSIVIYGQVGVGKSTLMRQYFFANRHNFSGGLFWLESSINQLCTKFGTMVQRITTGSLLDGANDSAMSITDARAWFEARSNWLIVFDCSDNIENDDDRCFQDLLPEAEAETAKATEIIRKEGCLPLTILDISRRMQAKGQSLEQFNLDLEPNSRMARVYGRIFAELRTNDHVDAINFLNILCLYETNVPFRMITYGKKILQSLNIGIESESSGRSPDIEYNISTLIRYGLLDHGKTYHRYDFLVVSGDSDILDPGAIDILTVYPSVQKFCVDRQRQEGDFQIWMAYAVRLYNESFREARRRMIARYGMYGGPLQDFQEYLRHGRRLWKLVNTCSNSEKRDLRLMFDELYLGLTDIQKTIDLREADAFSQVADDSGLLISIFNRGAMASSSEPGTPPDDTKPIRRIGPLYDEFDSSSPEPMDSAVPGHDNIDTVE
ncbi:hypothetical protein MMC18_002737 [Xylographa bjoerkii]|nr:hypothetical protein [Xylographa bjoerkii]